MNFYSFSIHPQPQERYRVFQNGRLIDGEEKEVVRKMDIDVY